MLNSIPVASPILRSFFKVQVGSPQRDAKEITDADLRRKAIVRVHARELFELAKRNRSDLSLDRETYTSLLKKWQQSEALSPDELAQIEAKYLNAWRDYSAANDNASSLRQKYHDKANQLGLDAASLWLDFD